MSEHKGLMRFVNMKLPELITQHPRATPRELLGMLADAHGPAASVQQELPPDTPKRRRRRSEGAEEDGE